MKKIIQITISLILAVSLISCGGGSGGTEPPKTPIIDLTPPPAQPTTFRTIPINFFSSDFRQSFNMSVTVKQSGFPDASGTAVLTRQYISESALETASLIIHWSKLAIKVPSLGVDIVTEGFSGFLAVTANQPFSLFSIKPDGDFFLGDKSNPTLPVFIGPNYRSLDFTYRHEDGRRLKTYYYVSASTATTIDITAITDSFDSNGVRDSRNSLTNTTRLNGTLQSVTLRTVSYSTGVTIIYTSL